MAKLDFADYDTAKGQKNPNYMVQITFEANAQDSQSAGERLGGLNTPGGNVISAYLPENFQFAFSSAYDQPFSQGFIQNSPLQGLAKMMGGSLTTQAMTAQVWQGTPSPEFSLSLVFMAENDPIEEVVRPISRLSKMALPGVINGLGGMLTPPGPRISLTDVAKAASNAAGSPGSANNQDLASNTDFVQTAKQKLAGLSKTLKTPTNNISLRVGRFLYFPSVVISSVSQTYDTMFDTRGKPLKATVDVTFTTFFVPTKDDVDEIFQL
jgi:hypothetical protein